MEDQALIQRVVGGSTESFGVLVGRYQDRLYRSLLAVTGRPEDAEDVVQEAFIQAFQKLEMFHGRSQFYTWIYRIAINYWISQRRKVSARTPVQSLQSVQSSDPDDPGDSPADQAIRVEEVGQLRAALAELATDFRTILVLREIDGCNYEGIAEILDIPLGTVRSRLHRARLLLKEQLERMSAS